LGLGLGFGLGLGLRLGLGLGIGLGLEANRVGLQECGQIGPGASSTPGKSGRGNMTLSHLTM
jgi:hypothetical protein